MSWNDLALAEGDQNYISKLNTFRERTETALAGLGDGLVYKGLWRADTNTPTIPAAASENAGWYWIVGVAGATTVDGESTWNLGDRIISNGSEWERLAVTPTGATLPLAEGLVTYFSPADVTSLGLVGDRSTDNADALEDLADLIYNSALMQKRGIKIRFPDGAFSVSRRIDFTLPLGYQNGLDIEGGGMDVTKFLPTKSNADGVFRFIMTENSQAVNVRRMSFRSRRSQFTEYTANNGTALEIIGAAEPGNVAYGVVARMQSIVEEVLVGGESDNNSPAEDWEYGLWADGIRMKWLWWPTVRQCMLTGIYYKFTADPVPDVPGIMAKNEANMGDPETWEARVRADGNQIAAIHFVHCYDARAKGNNINGFWLTGIHWDSHNIADSSRGWEGGSLEEGNVIAQTVDAVLVTQDHQESVISAPDFKILPGNHLNAARFGAHIKWMRMVKISGTTFFPPYNFGDYQARQMFAFLEDRPAGIFIEGCGNVIITGNSFEEPGFYEDSDKYACSIRGGGTLQKGVLIYGNGFAHQGVGIDMTDVTAYADYDDVYTMWQIYGNAWGGQGFWDQIPQARKYLDPNRVAVIHEYGQFNHHIAKVNPLQNAASPQHIREMYLDNASALSAGTSIAQQRATFNNSAGGKESAYTLDVKVTSGTDGDESSTITVFVRGNGVDIPIFGLAGDENTVSVYAVEDSGVAAAPIHRLVRDVPSEDGQILGAYEFWGRNSANTIMNMGTIRVDVTESEAGNEGSTVKVFLRKDGEPHIPISFGPDGVTVIDNLLTPSIAFLNFPNDTAAEAGGVPQWGLYHTNGTAKIRLI